MTPPSPACPFCGAEICSLQKEGKHESYFQFVWFFTCGTYTSKTGLGGTAQGDNCAQIAALKQRLARVEAALRGLAIGFRVLAEYHEGQAGKSTTEVVKRKHEAISETYRDVVTITEEAERALEGIRPTATDT